MRHALLVALLVAFTGCNRSAPDRKESETRPWEVTIRGYGPISTGMTVEQASAAGRPIGQPSSDFPECNFVHFTNDSASGVRFMTTFDTIVRVEVDDSTVKTSHGAGVGDPEAKIVEAYPGRVRVEPHKYEDGHYLIVSPGTEADSTYRLIFETDGKRVTRYRSGRVPEVEYVEGCS